ncbi:GNAT family N-acetyltransferase [Paraburkholderia sp. HD33-4]|uniref:GNAT family N-acetyltransferase n=1 Tax=Paraburkholderia sp. HD33-4 TaxID=2883242 RepID=UPI001F3EE056|nr:GNAT family N-acetyltransferase [Paraburkholderia sp. HD33-4]
MMQQDEYSVRTMTALDLQQCHDLTRRLRWAHRGEDWAQAFRVSKGLVLEFEGNVVGTAIACVKGDYSSIGLITIDPCFQGRGLGRELTNRVLGVATKNVSLVSTAEGRRLYESLGFEENGVVYQLTASPDDRSVAANHEPARAVRMARAQDFEDIYQLYRSATGVFSKVLLDDLLSTADAVFVAAQANNVVGFCIVRPFGQGAVVGPIVADSVELAVDLVAESTRCFRDTTLRIDVNDSDAFAQALVPLGFRAVSRAPKMFLGAVPSTDSALCQYSLASQALL